jgi:putative tryptophan/tyrosine transport system substrate-binding protein
MRRREFIGLLGGAAAWPVAALAQQQAMPVIGFISSGTRDGGRNRLLAGVRRGLAELGYVEGQNFVLEDRYAEAHYDRLPSFMDDFIRRRVAVIIVGFTAGLAVAKAATQSIPIAFTMGSDPVENGFVASLNKPGGNITGIFTLNLALAAKRLELLRELVPSATTFAFIVNPLSPKFTEAETREIQNGARTLGVKLLILEARNQDEFEAAFEASIREGAGGIVLGSEGLFITSPAKLVALAERYQLPAIYADDKPATMGGLISYGADQDDGYRLAGQYAGRILKGEKPVNMPVQQSTKTRLVVNLKTAKTLGLNVPVTLLGRADDVIE